MNSRQLALVIGMTFVAAASHAAVLKVPQQYPTIQAAIDAAAEGDTVKVAAGTYFGGFTIQGKAITLAGVGASQTILDANSQGAVLTISATGSGVVTLSGVTVTRGRLNAIKVSDSNLTVRNTVMTENLGCTGIALYAVQSTVTLVRNRVESNRILPVGSQTQPNCGESVVLVEGSRGTGEVQITGNVFQNQHATGLVLREAGTATVSNNVFRNHEVTNPYIDQGAFRNINMPLTLQNNLFVNNTGALVGAVFLDTGATTPMKVVGNSFVGNHGGSYGASLTFDGWGAELVSVQNNKFDDPTGEVQIVCTLPTVIDHSNVTTGDPALLVDGPCVYTP